MSLTLNDDYKPDGRGRHGNHVRASAHPRWNPDRIIDAQGYVRVRVGLVHPLADCQGYCYEHTLVMAAALLRRLGPEEVVHHRNGDRTDNRLENLMLTTSSEHGKIHPKTRDERGRFAPKGVN